MKRDHEKEMNGTILEQEPVAGISANGISTGSVIVSFAVLGAVAALSQSTILREAMVTFHGTELTMGGFYGSWFFWIAAGAWASPRLKRLYGNRPKNLYILLSAVFPVALAAQVLVLRYWRIITGVSPLEIITLEETLAGTFIGTAGCGFLMGVLFPIAAGLLGDEGKDSVSRIYMWEAIGSLLGGMAFTFILSTYLAPEKTLAVCFLLMGAASSVLAVQNSRRLHFIAPALSLMLGVVLLTPAGAGLNRLTEEARWNSLQKGYHLESTLYSPYSHIALGRTGVETAEISADYGVFYNGVLGVSFPDHARNSLKAAHIKAQNPWAKNILLMGGGVEGLVQELVKFPSLEKIDVVMLDPYAISAIKKRLPRDARKALEDPRVNIVQTDPGRYLAEKCRPRQYDTIVSLFPRPTTVSLNRFFTAEIFADGRRVLGDGAFIVFFSRDEIGYITEEERNSLAAVYKTLQSVFTHTTMLSGKLHYMAGSLREGRLSFDGETLGLRYRSLELDDWPYPVDAFPGRTLDEEMSGRLRSAVHGAPVRINREYAPTALFHGLIYVGGLSRSKLLPMLKSLRNTGPSLFFIIIVIGFAMGVFRRAADPDPEKDKKRLSRLAIGSVGFASMTLQVVVLVSFSARHGSIYREMGMLTGVLMTGLALGALTGRRLKYISKSSRLELTLGLFLMGLLAWSLPLIITIVGKTHGIYGRMAFGVISLTIGFLTGVIFPLGVRHHDPQDKAASLTASFLNAADHMGALFGGLFAGTIWLPIFGTTTTCHFAAATLTGTVALMIMDGVFEKWNLRQKPIPEIRWTFPWKNFSWSFAAITLVVVGASTVISAPGEENDYRFVEEPEKEIKTEELRSEYVRHKKRKGVSVVEELKPFPHLKLLWKNSLAEIVFSSMHTAGDVQGYGGPIELIIRMKNDGTIVEARLGRHSETPSYVREVPEWLNKFADYPPERPMLGAEGVDAISGATVTTEAIKQILSRSRSKAMQDILNIQDPSLDEVAPGAWSEALKSLHFWSFPVFMLFALFAYMKARPGLRIVCLACGFVLLGLWLNIPLNVVDLGQMSQFVFPSTPIKVLTVFAVVLLGVFLGQVWCGYACPFGAAQELVWLLLHPKGIRSERSIRQSDRSFGVFEMRARYTKFLLLGLVLSAYAVTREQGFLTFDPMTWVFVLDMNLWRWVLLISIAVGSLLLFRPWCRYLCPVGACLALSNKVALLDGKGPKRRVNRCDIGVTGIKHADCIRCNRCVK